ncbi:MAG TPA: DUF3300 domain-containing protein [Edaphobacter sp.]|nr:DUF3300 domain-containing protein [Edaphobacter sp.]
MTHVQARSRIRSPRRIGGKLPVRSNRQSRLHSARHGRSAETYTSDAMLEHSFGLFLACVVKVVAITPLLLLACLAMILVCSPITSSAQPVALTPPQLDHLVARIALYPDPLLAQVLTASTYWSEIPEAAAWADEHSYLKGDALAQAIQADHLQWDPSILALLPFPSVLDMMARDLSWTQQLGNAVLTQDPDVMNAVQRMRQRARSYGYLAPNSYINVVSDGGYIEILPVNANVLYVPYYDPLVVFAPPPPGFAIGSAIHFGPGISIGAVFGGWGWWLGSGFVWPSHTILIDRRPWTRVWVSRFGYVHPYAHPWVRPIGPRMEVHRLRR